MNKRSREDSKTPLLKLKERLLSLKDVPIEDRLSKLTLLERDIYLIRSLFKIHVKLAMENLNINVNELEKLCETQKNKMNYFLVGESDKEYLYNGEDKQSDYNAQIENPVVLKSQKVTQVLDETGVIINKSISQNSTHLSANSELKYETFFDLGNSASRRSLYCCENKVDAKEPNNFEHDSVESFSNILGVQAQSFILKNEDFKRIGIFPTFENNDLTIQDSFDNQILK